MKKYLLMMILISLFGCNGNQKEIIILLGCPDEGEMNDLIFSTESQAILLKKKKIKVSEDRSSSKCGYVLIDGEKEHQIQGALSDNELKKALNDFYK